MNMMGLGLSTRILDHVLIDIYAHQRHLWIGLGCFYDPATCPASDVEHTTQDGRVGLLCQDTTHHYRRHTILDCQTGQFFLATLRDVCTTIFISPWAKGGRHDVSLLPLCCLSSCSCSSSTTASSSSRTPSTCCSLP